jgi:glucose/arabinose dehydrogenase
VTRRLLAALLLLAAAAACGSDDDSSGTTSQPSSTVAAPTTSSSTTTEAPSTTTEPPPLEEAAVTLTPFAEVEQPIVLTTRAGHEGVLYVAERPGRVRVLRDGVVDGAPLLDISDSTNAEGERGLLGMAFSPDGAFLYVSYTNNGGDSRLDEYAMGAGDADIDLASRREVLAVDQPFPNHNGGHITFGPDGLLYVGLGDGGSGGDPQGNGQDTGALLGKILRIDPRQSGDAPYGVPADNPFAGGGGRGEVWVYGVRNPWRFTFDRATGDLWVADVGQNALEEVSLLRAGQQAGANLGWNLFEGTERYAATGSAPPETVLPIHEYGRDEGVSITGGYVYRGSRIPALTGAYLFGDYSAAVVKAIGLDAGGSAVRVVVDLADVDGGQLASFAEDGDGELYVLSLSGTVYRIDPASP